MERSNSFLTTPVAILLSSFVIGVAILVHGGVVKIGGGTSAPVAVAPAAPPQAAAPAAKSEADIINNLKEEAKKLSLDTGKFNSCLDSGDKASAVKTDADEGSKVGVNGTPAFFINGRLLSGAVPFEQFKTIIEEELAGTAPAATQRTEIGVGNLPMMGNANAKVTLVEFSDYECPFCSRHFTQTEIAINKEYVDTGKVKFYYRDFPLSQIHPGAQKAAEAARCAGDQNKYWQYHDVLFLNQANIF